jgi:hypothetical protein
LVQAAVITAVLIQEHGAPSGPSLATPGISAQSPSLASLERKGDRLPSPQRWSFTASSDSPLDPVQSPPPAASLEMKAAPSIVRKLSDEEIAGLVADGRRLMAAGDVPNARLVLQQAAEAGNATATLELGATYDPIELEKLGVLDLARRPVVPSTIPPLGPTTVTSKGFPGAPAAPGEAAGPRVQEATTAPGAIPVQTAPAQQAAPPSAALVPDIAMARKWYQKAKDLGSTEAADRLERLSRPWGAGPTGALAGGPPVGGIAPPSREAVADPSVQPVPAPPAGQPSPPAGRPSAPEGTPSWLFPGGGPAAPPAQIGPR